MVDSDKGTGRARPSARRPSARAARTARGTAGKVQAAATTAASGDGPTETSSPQTRGARGKASKKPAAKRPAAKKSTEKGSTAKKPATGGATTKKAAARRPTAKRARPPVARATVDGADATPEGAGLGLHADASTTSPESAANKGEPSIDEHLQDIQRKLERVMAEADSAAGDPAARQRAAEAISQIARRLAPDGALDPSDEESLFGTARGLLSTNYYMRQWGRMAMRNRSEEVDGFGLDPTYEAKMLPIFEAFYRTWFRVRAEGLGHIPSEGRALIVSNHSGTVPLDGVMLKMAVRLEGPRTEMRWLAEDFVFHMPFLGAFLNRIGAVRACQENAERLLSKEKLVAVFPEGIMGIGKLYSERYRLQRFGRGGYVKLALRTGSPIVPTAVVGAEETNPLLTKVVGPARAFGLPYVPITPTFPWLGPLGLVPLPTRWQIVFDEPMDLSEYGPEGADDALLVSRLNEKVRSRIQGMIDQTLSTRTSVFFR